MSVFKRILTGGIAVSALSVGLSTAALAQTESPDAAQPAAEEQGDAIVVTGIRASQRASIDLKRENIAVVDSIVAEDLGKLPDQNVAESLQRIAGVTIERNRGEGRFVTDSVMIDVECAALGALAPGDTFEIDGVIYEVRGEPLRDALRHVWKAEAREA